LTPMKSSDSARRLIEAIIQERSLELRPISLQLGRNHAYLQQFLRRSKPAHLPEDVRHDLATILGVPEKDLRPTDTGPAETQELITYENVLRKVPLPVIEEFPRDLPIRGNAVGGEGGHFDLNGQVVDWARRPPRLMGVKDAYGLYVSGSSMSPWREEGQLVCVHPHAPVRIGDYVVIQTKPKHDGDAPEAYIKRLVRRTESELRLSQLTPAMDVNIRMDQVLTIHRVMEWTDLLGV
jgi:phage repressor protein C with HTH and peptisase S24 domain